jgi:hypothetical protein
MMRPAENTTPFLFQLLQVLSSDVEERDRQPSPLKDSVVLLLMLTGGVLLALYGFLFGPFSR